MKNKVKLTKEEMKNILGGYPPTCTITCYQPGGSYVTVIVGNYPVGFGCNDFSLHCPQGTYYSTCACQSGGGQ